MGVYDYIKNGDCLKFMKELPDESVDLIITSPPYNIGETHHTGNKRYEAYGVYKDDMKEDEYQKWQIDILNECYRILKQDGSMMYNHKNRIKNGVQITPYEWLLKSKFIIKQEIVWFNRSQNFDKVRFYPMTERVYWLAKDSSTKLFNSINHHDLFTTDEWNAQGTKGEFKRAFPQKMAEDLISCFPNAEIVLDPFLGSGTTAVASINMGRHYIGFEIDEKFYNIAKERIAEEKAQIRMF